MPELIVSETSERNSLICHVCRDFVCLKLQLFNRNVSKACIHTIYQGFCVSLCVCSIRSIPRPLNVAYRKGTSGSRGRTRRPPTHPPNDRGSLIVYAPNVEFPFLFSLAIHFKPNFNRDRAKNAKKYL